MSPRGRLTALVAAVAVVCALIGAEPRTAARDRQVAAGDPRELPRLEPSDLHYLGAFRVPPAQSESNASEDALAYGGRALGMSPRGLYWGGHDWHGRLAEISIPAVGETADIITSLADVPNLSSIHPDPDPGAVVLGGTLLHNQRLVVSAYVYYDASGRAHRSHFVGAPTLTDFTGPYALDGDVPGALAGYMAAIPQAWQALFGAPALTGLCCVSIIGRSSFGPALSAFDPDALGHAHAGTEVPALRTQATEPDVPALRTTDGVVATPLLRYSFDTPLHPDFDRDGRANDWFNLSTMVRGVAFPDDTRTVLFIGRHGTGPYCYGTGPECDDPAEPHQGTHAYPYQQQVWFYDANDLLAVKEGRLRPHDPRPYAVMRLPSSDEGVSSNVVTGAAYDPRTRRLYVAAGASDQPVVHVFHIATPDRLR
jgi:hypothetical protein